jgi:hypothetical protein
MVLDIELDRANWENTGLHHDIIHCVFNTVVIDCDPIASE